MRPERKRPLRTYGRQRQSDTLSEAPTKRRRVETPGSGASALSACSDQPRLPVGPDLPKSEPVKRGSILAFFKPLKSSSSATPSPKTSDPIDPESPPSSPPVLAKSRKRRRLTTRPELETGKALGEPSSALGDGEGVGDALDEPDHAATTRGDEEGGVPGPTKGERITLREAKPASLNAGEASADSGDGARKTKPRARWRPKRARVQTTLNLSIRNDPGFTICKDCDMLYNPLNEKDRKDHARQHAAAQRKKAAGVPS
jgi:hypothetical protein